MSFLRTEKSKTFALNNLAWHSKYCKLAWVKKFEVWFWILQLGFGNSASLRKTPEERGFQDTTSNERTRILQN